MTNNELGFDYLRDHLSYEPAELTVTGRALNFAIVDEADSILVDEARTRRDGNTSEQFYARCC